MMKPSLRKKVNEWLITLPSLAWLTIFFLIPVIGIFVIAFKPSKIDGSVGEGWSLNTILSMGFPNYPSIIWRTIWLTCLGTILCLLLAVPTGYFIARTNKKWRNYLLMLIIVPFWTNFLIRIFAWKVVLHPDGLLKNFLAYMHIVDPNSILLYNSWAVLLVIVYSYLPFAILPIYAAAEKFDFSLFEAALDLGANRYQAFGKIFIPNIKVGLVSATLMVFIPALGSYIIPELVGGPDGEMIGNKIVGRVYTDRNLPQASALSAILTFVIMVPMLITLSYQQRQEQKDTKKKKGGIA